MNYIDGGGLQAWANRSQAKANAYRGGGYGFYATPARSGGRRRRG